MNVLTEIRERREDSYKILDDASSLPDVDILQKSQNRRKTDNIFLIVFAACIVLLLPFLIYTLCYSDINRLKGYDGCGNICGQTNIKYDEWNCTGQDMSLKPIAQDGECMEDTGNPWSVRMHLDGKTIFNFFHRAVWKIVLVSLVPLSLSLILVVLFRYVPAVAVWSILILSWLLFTVTGLLWLYMWNFLWNGISVAIFCIISVLVLCTWILFKLNNIRLVTLLLKEATRAVFEIRKMCYISFGALSVLIVILVIHTTIIFHFATAGKLIEVYTDSGYFKYVPNNVMLTTLGVSSVIAFWAILFVFGVQDMTVSGAVARWYASKNQENMSDAVPLSFFATIKYHLGTIVLGSVMMTIMSIPRVVLQFLATFSALKEKADSWLRWLDGFFTNNSYIITAMYGTSFFQSGKQAAKLLKLSIGHTRDLNLYANLVIMTGHSLVIFVSTIGAYITLYYSVGIYGSYSGHFALVVLGISSFCAHTILGTLKVSLNTLFCCATEELLRNKEADLPYTMTMKELLDGSNKLLLQKVQNRPPSNIAEKSFYIKLFVFIFVSISCVLFFVAYFI